MESIFFYGQKILLKKSVRMEFSKIYGLSYSRVKFMMRDAGIGMRSNVEDSLGWVNLVIVETIRKCYRTDTYLKLQRKRELTQLRKIKNLRTNRAARRLPVRGQRTRSNSRTNKKLVG